MVAGLLVLFRGRSRHTYGFDSPFDLPSLELRALCGGTAPRNRWLSAALLGGRRRCRGADGRMRARDPRPRRLRYRGERPRPSRRRRTSLRAAGRRVRIRGDRPGARRKRGPSGARDGAGGAQRGICERAAASIRARTKLGLGESAGWRLSRRALSKRSGRRPGRSRRRLERTAQLQGLAWPVCAQVEAPRRADDDGARARVSDGQPRASGRRRARARPVLRRGRAAALRRRARRRARGRRRPRCRRLPRRRARLCGACAPAAGAGRGRRPQRRRDRRALRRV